MTQVSFVTSTASVDNRFLRPRSDTHLQRPALSDFVLLEPVASVQVTTTLASLMLFEYEEFEAHFVAPVCAYGDREHGDDPDDDQGVVENHLV